MIHLRSARLGAIDAELANAFPFSVPVIKALAGDELAFVDPQFAVCQTYAEWGSDSNSHNALLTQIESSGELESDPNSAPSRPVGRFRRAWISLE